MVVFVVGTTIVGISEAEEDTTSDFGGEASGRTAEAAAICAMEGGLVINLFSNSVIRCNNSALVGSGGGLHIRECFHKPDDVMYFL